jgi:hypothetical protein
MGAEKDLIEFVRSMTDDELLAIEEELGEGYFRLHIREAERRQAQHDIQSVEDIVVELLRNARDAGAETIFLATHKKGDRTREIVLIDDGHGVPRKLQKKIFEPRVTSRLFSVVEDGYGIHGRGMALYSIKLNSSEAFVAFSQPGQGCSVKVKVDLQSLPEKRDQSTLPELKQVKDGYKVNRGIRNIWRVLFEFYFHFPYLEIYYGSPTEIAATIYNLALAGDLNHCFLKKATRFKKASEVKDGFKKWGLNLSERNTYRIISQEIDPLLPLSSFLGLQKKPSVKDLKRPLHRLDLEDFQKKIRKVTCQVMEKYFLTPIQIKLSQRGKKINISIILEDIDKIS